MTSNTQGGAISSAVEGLTLRQRVSFVCLTALVLTTLGIALPTAQARAADYPGADEVAAAKAAVANTAASVNQLDRAIEKLEDALYKADVASRLAEEEYSEAQWANVEAQRQLFAANNRAAEAERSLEEARGNLAVLAMAAYRDGHGFGSLEAMMSADGFEDVISRIEGQDRASTDAQVIVERVRAAELVARTMREYAQDAAENAIVAEQAASEAYDAAVAAQAAAKQAVQEAEATRAQLITRLAQLRKTSEALEAERQAGLKAAREARERRQAEKREQEREEAERKAKEEEERKKREEEEKENNPTPTSTKTSTPTSTKTSTPTETETDDPDPEPTETKTSTPKPTDDGPPPDANWTSSASDGIGAARFAKDQIGKKYRSGGTGPNAYDCSGLAHTAWGSVGYYIPRSSRTIYPAVAHVPYSERRKGDMMFWGYNSNPDRMYHTAVYVGNNKIVEGSSTYGIQIRDWRNWRRGDMMPYVGRP